MPDPTQDRDRYYPLVRVLGQYKNHGIMEVVSVHKTGGQAIEAYLAAPDKRGLAVFPRPFNVEPKPGDMHSFLPGKFNRINQAEDMDRALKQAMERTQELGELKAPKIDPQTPKR